VREGEGVGVRVALRKVGVGAVEVEGVCVRVGREVRVLARRRVEEGTVVTVFEVRPDTVAGAVEEAELLPTTLLGVGVEEGRGVAVVTESVGGEEGVGGKSLGVEVVVVEDVGEGVGLTAAEVE